jgi:hypothetical protein
MGVLADIAVATAATLVLSIALSVAIGAVLHRRAAGPLRLVPVTVRREVVPFRRVEGVGRDWRT